MTDPRIIVGTFAETSGSFANCLILAESIRTFGGSMRGVPIVIYAAETAGAGDERDRPRALDVEVRRLQAPAEAKQFFFAGKVFAAARAEADARTDASILAWLDEDTVVLDEPRELVLPAGVDLAYKPVMHRNIGSTYSEPVNDFWGRVFSTLSVPESALFPMTTVASREVIRPYINAGLLVVRPERGILVRWARNFSALCRDPYFADLSARDVRIRVFLHQAALTGTILAHVAHTAMLELPDRYNYPLFFHEEHDAALKFDSVENVATIRYDVFFDEATPGWPARLKGSKKKIDWLEQRFSRP